MTTMTQDPLDAADGTCGAVVGIPRIAAWLAWRGTRACFSPALRRHRMSMSDTSLLILPRTMKFVNISENGQK